MWYHKARGDREQDLWRYWQPEGCIKLWYDRASGYGCLSNKCLKGEQWSSDLAVSCTLTKHCDIQSENTRFKMLWLSPLTTIQIDVGDSSVLPLLFLRSLSILSGCRVINIHSCFQYRKLSWWNIIHILGFITPNFLPICVMTVAALSIFQAWIWMRVDIGNFLNDLGVRNIFDTKLHGLGTCLCLAGCFVAIL